LVVNFLIIFKDTMCSLVRLKFFWSSGDQLTILALDLRGPASAKLKLCRTRSLERQVDAIRLLPHSLEFNLTREHKVSLNIIIKFTTKFNNSYLPYLDEAGRLIPWHSNIFKRPWILITLLISQSLFIFKIHIFLQNSVPYLYYLGLKKE